MKKLWIGLGILVIILALILWSFLIEFTPLGEVRKKVNDILVVYPGLRPLNKLALASGILGTCDYYTDWEGSCYGPARIRTECTYGKCQEVKLVDCETDKTVHDWGNLIHNQKSTDEWCPTSCKITMKLYGTYCELCEEVCSCTDWQDVGCGVSPCGAYQMKQVRSCTPDKCADEYRCVERGECVPPDQPLVKIGIEVKEIMLKLMEIAW